MYRHHAGAGIRRNRCGIEGGILNIVAHHFYGVRTARLGLQQRATAIEPETAPIGRQYFKVRIEILVGKPALQLQSLENSGHVRTTGKAHRLLHAPCIDRTRAHPVGDRDILIGFIAVIDAQCGVARAAVELGAEHVLAAQLRQL